MIFGLMISLFWITRRQASFSCRPEWLVQDVIVIKLSENLSMPSGQMEWDLIIMLRLLRFRNELRLSVEKLLLIVPTIFLPGEIATTAGKPKPRFRDLSRSS